MKFQREHHIKAHKKRMKKTFNVHTKFHIQDLIQ